MTLAMPAGYAASSAPSGLQMLGGLQMPVIPKTNSTPAPAPTTGTTSGLTTSPSNNTGNGITPATSVPTGLSLGTTPPPAQTTPTAFQLQSIPNVTLHPNITTPSGAIVNPSTGGLVAPSGAQMPVTPSLPANSAASGTQFYKPGPNDAGYDATNPQMVYDSTGKGLNYTDYINAGGKSDFSNVVPGSVPQSQAPAAPAVTTPAAGLPTTDTGVIPPANPADLNSGFYTNPEYQAAQTAYKNAQQLTPDEIANEQAINDITASEKLGVADTNHQPIPMEFITGQAKAIEDRANANLVPLQAKAALLQAKRTANVEATKFALDQASSKLAAFQAANKPVSTPFGTSLTNPATGAVIGGLGSSTGTGTDATGGATDLQILGYLQKAGLSGTRYNMPGLIAAVRAGASAQDIIAGKANVAGATAGAAAQASNKSQFMIDGNNNLIQVTPTVAGAGAQPSTLPTVATGGAFSPKTSSTGNTQFTLGSDGKTVLANGTPVDLATFKQMTGQTAVPDNKVDFSAVQKSGKATPAASTNAPIAPRGLAGTPTPTQTTTPAPQALTGVANQYFLSGDDSMLGKTSLNTRNQITQQVEDYAKSIGIPNWSAAKVAALNKGDAANYAQQIQYLSTTSRSVANAENGFKQVLSAFPDLNKASSPLWNKTANELAATLTGGNRNAFEAGLTEIGNEYAQVFSRGGATTVSSHVAAADVVNGNLSMKDLQGVLNELQAQGKIVVDGAKTAVNGILNNFGGSSSGTGSSTFNGITLPH